MSCPASGSLLCEKPGAIAPLDPGFAPAVLANRKYRQAVAEAGSQAVQVGIALERESGCVERSDLTVLPLGSEHDADTCRYVERHIKFLLWARGGWRVFVSGPDAIADTVRARYGKDGERGFDADLMARVYDHEFTVEHVPETDLPAERGAASSLGGHLDGCRIGFDLGASDYKLAAVIDGKPVFDKEIPWQPSPQKDSSYHYDHILAGLREAASHMPRVDAIGGSAAGIYVNNRVKAASLFRSVPPEDFKTKVEPIFERLQKEFNVPLVVANDGDVTALAGAMSLQTKAILGIAMGSSEAAGYLDGSGSILGWLNELAFAPVDFNPEAPADEWSGDRGVGALYFSQQAVNKLAPAAGISFPPDMLLPERLKEVQALANTGDARAEKIFETIGVYLAYALPHYADYYAFANVLILGRVTSGRGGEMLLDRARAVLKQEFPALAEKVALHVPDEKSRRVGQAVAAASLPELDG